jgi:hypothetical protein
MHDWNYLLGHADLLSHDVMFARLLRVVAALILFLSLALAAWVVRRNERDDR